MGTPRHGGPGRQAIRKSRRQQRRRAVLTRRLVAAALAVVGTGTLTAWGPVEAGTRRGGPVDWYRSWRGTSHHAAVAVPAAPVRKPRKGWPSPVGDTLPGAGPGGAAGRSDPAGSGGSSGPDPGSQAADAGTAAAVSPAPSVSSAPAGTSGPASGGSLDDQIFSSASVQSGRLPASAPLAPDSAATVAKLARQASYSRTSAPVAGFFDAPFNTYLATFVPIYTVPADAPRYPVTWVDDNGKPVDPSSDGLGGGQPLQPWLDQGVPIPADATAGTGSDAELAVWQPSTDTYWEFWQLRPVRNASGAVTSWTCRYGGRITDASRSNGVFPHDQGAGATSIAYGGLEIRAHDWASGVIDHALALQLPVTANRFVAPATRNDSAAAVPNGDARDAIAEGTRFRLPNGFDPSSVAAGSDDRSKLLRMILTAARDHGIYVVDTTGGTMNLVAEPSSAYGTAYGLPMSLVPSWWEGEGMFWGESSVAQKIPWNQLQVVAP